MEKKKKEKYATTENELRNALREQLKLKVGSESPIFLDLIEEYIMLWKMERRLKNDVFGGTKSRGYVIEKPLSTGKTQYIVNPSIKEITTISKQKQNILEKLGINPENYVAEGADEM